MAKIELRDFKSRRMLLVIPETKEEEVIIEHVIGKEEHSKFKGTTVWTDHFELYLRIERDKPK